MLKRRNKIIIIGTLCAISIIMSVFIISQDIREQKDAEIKEISEYTIKEDRRYSNKNNIYIYAKELKTTVPDSADNADIIRNTQYLQQCIDTVSSAGGGIVHIPAGTYYFASGGVNTRYKEEYVIKCKSNVTIVGSGSNESTGTVLKPYGTVTKTNNNEGGIDMFYFNDYIDYKEYENKNKQATYLENANFKNFVINSENTHKVGTYNSSGKGFMINLFKNCNWDNVVVKNTDGTGFGMDCPINCTIKNCVAINCGKAASATNSGASGFGIGTGYSNNEYIHISNCEAYGNAKYGIFFEHQGRFNKNNYPATKSQGMVASNCRASGNQYDFGGEKANDVTFENCVTDSSYKNGIYPNKVAILFCMNSIRTHVINCEFDKTNLLDVSESDWYYKQFCWGIDNAVINGSASNGGVKINPLDKCTKEVPLIFLHRMENNDSNTILSAASEGADAVNWAKTKGIIDTSYNNTDFTKAEFIEVLWKYKGDKSKSAEQWAIDEGIAASDNMNASITRAQVITMLYKFSKLKSDYKITYNLNGGTILSSNPTSYMATSSSITLNNPTKSGYIFKGWTGSNGSTPSKTVTITRGTTGDKVYTANWEEEIKDSAEKNIFIGDSILVEQSHIIGENTDIYSVKRGAGIDWIKSTGVPAVEGLIENNTNIIITTGGNDLFDKYLNNGNVDIDGVVNRYKEYFNSKAKEWNALGANVYMTSIGPYDDSKIDKAKRKVNNADGIKFNEKLKRELQGITFIDIYSGIIDDFNNKNPDLTREDGSHGVALLYYKRYKIIKDRLGQDYTPPYMALSKMTDVSSNSEYYNPIKWAYKNAYIDPITSNKFGGTNSINKIDALNLIWRSQGIPYFDRTKTFTDINEKDTYYDTVNWAVAKNIATGKTNGTFAPKEICSRGDFISFIWKVAGSPKVTTQSGFTDVRQGSSYYDAINWATNEKIIKKDSTTFLPNGSCTRQDAVAFLYNYYNDEKITEYEITYDLDGGHVDGNPTTYTIEDTVTLKSPQKDGYQFKGWTGSNGSTPSKTVTITRGTTGDKYYVANWEKIVEPISKIRYTVKHYKETLEDNQYEEVVEDRETLSVEYGTQVTAKVNEYQGFTKPSSVTTRITTNGQEIEYRYKRNKYHVSIVKGTGVDAVTAKEEYKYGEQVSINATEKIGYENIKFNATTKLDNALQTQNTYSFVMPAEDITITASATPIEYSITYDLQGGKIVGAVTKYTIEDRIILKKPIREGYKFKGWTGSNGNTPTMNIVIETGTTGNKNYIANWKENETNELEISVGYSETKPTNKNVTVTIMANIKLKELDGWNLSEDKMSLSKEYAENKSESIQIVDELGSTATANIEVKNIDKTSPQIEVEYEYSKDLKTVKVIMKSNEKIKEKDGWNKENEYTLTKVYNQNRQDSIFVEDEAGNKTSIIIKIDKIANQSGNQPNKQPENPNGRPEKSDGEGENKNDKNNKDNQTDKKMPVSNNQQSDNTFANKKIPQTGINTILPIIIVAFIILSIIVFRKYKKCDF